MVESWLVDDGDWRTWGEALYMSKRCPGVLYQVAQHHRGQGTSTAGGSAAMNHGRRISWVGAFLREISIRVLVSTTGLHTDAFFGKWEV